MKIEFEWNDLVDLVDEASSDDINRIAHAISDIINVLNSGNVNDVDLSNYFTKDEMIEMIEVINNELNEREFTSNRVTTIDEMSIMQGSTYPTVKAVFDFVNDKIGSSESETVVVNLSIGNFELIADKTVSEVYELYKEGKNIVLLRELTEIYNDGTRVKCENIFKIIGIVGNDIIFSYQETENPLNFSYITASIDDNTWNEQRYVYDSSGENVDLSNYFTKEEINNMDLASKLWVSDRINTQLDNYYNKMEINEMIGDVETSLENIIEKYGLGGDAS